MHIYTSVRAFIFRDPSSNDFGCRRDLRNFFLTTTHASIPSLARFLPQTPRDTTMMGFDYIVLLLSLSALFILSGKNGGRQVGVQGSHRQS